MVGGRTWRFHCTNVRMCRSLPRPRPHVFVFVWKRKLFSPFSKKKIRVHTLRFWMVFARPKENAIAIENGTSFDERMRINWYPSPLRHRFHKPPFPSIHTSTAKRRRQKSLLWRAFLKTHVFGDRFYRIRVDGRPNWRKKILFQTKTYMWTGPKLPCCFSRVFLKKIQTPPLE